MGRRKEDVEFLAIFLIAPLIWSTGFSDATDTKKENVKPRPSSIARIEDREGRMVLMPPQDASLTMEVTENPGEAGGRAPASNIRRVDVTVSAP